MISHFFFILAQLYWVELGLAIFIVSVDSDNSLISLTKTSAWQLSGLHQHPRFLPLSANNSFLALWSLLIMSRICVSYLAKLSSRVRVLRLKGLAHLDCRYG